MGCNEGLSYRAIAIEDGGTGGLRLGFGYAAAGQLVVLREGAARRALARYEYDGLGRLSRALAASNTPLQLYRWDAPATAPPPRTAAARVPTTKPPAATTC